MGRAARKLVVPRGSWRAVCALLIAATCSAAVAQELTWQPWAGLEGRYSSNLQLSESDEKARYSVAALPGVDLRRRTEASQMDASAWLRASDYANEKTLNSVDSFVDLRMHGRGERHRPSLWASFAHDSAIYSELNDTGNVEANTRRDSLIVAPGWESRLTERQGIALDYSYERVRYPQGASFGLYDYVYQAATAAHRWFINAKDFWQFSLAASRYDALDLDNQFQDWGVQLGVSRAFSPTLSGRILLGARRGKSTLHSTDAAAGEASSQVASNGGTLDVQMERNGERSTIGGTLGRGIEPSGGGYAVLRDRLSVKGSYRASAELTVSLTAEASRRKSLRHDITGIDRDYYQAEPRLSWWLMPQLRVSAGYRYRYQIYSDSTTGAQDHSVDVHLEYLWDRSLIRG